MAREESTGHQVGLGQRGRRSGAERSAQQDHTPLGADRGRSREKGPAAPCHYPVDTSAQEIELARAAVKQGMLGQPAADESIAAIFASLR